MRCKVCKEYFERGTSTLLFNDVCLECHDKYVTYEVIKRTPQEEIKEYQQYINCAREDIKKLEKDILRSEDNIKFWEEEIKKLI